MYYIHIYLAVSACNTMCAYIMYIDTIIIMDGGLMNDSWGL